jgi:phosphoribosyl 1,2-cyclic phosphodiesterase
MNPGAEGPELSNRRDTSHSRSVLRLKFWGVRGSIPTPGPTTVLYGGNTSCVEVRAEGEIIILDGGTGLRLLGRELLVEYGQRPIEATLLLTHTHWDHIQGLPFFPPVYQPQNHLRILGYEGARKSLLSVLTGQMESPFFPVALDKVPANIKIEELKKMDFRLGAVRVQASPAFHPGVCVGYRVSTEAGSIAFFPDNELRHSRAPAAPSTRQPPGTEFTAKANRELIQFLTGTDVLIMDAQYDWEEYQEHVGWGHGCVDEVVALALQAGIKQLFLFHHDPDHDDERITRMTARARELVRARKGRLMVDAAREGLVVQVPVKEAQPS